MPTLVGHALVGASVGHLAKIGVSRPFVNRLAWYGALAAMLPDADVVAFRFHIPYGDPFGHRGFSHSLVFAALSAALFSWRIRATSQHRAELGYGARGFLICTAVLFVAAASHPMLDMLTDGGYGVALWGPFSWERIFFSVTPIPVSPIGVNARLWSVLAWEFTFFLPLAVGTAFFARLTSAWARALGLGLAAIGTTGAFFFRLSM